MSDDLQIQTKISAVLLKRYTRISVWEYSNLLGFIIFAMLFKEFRSEIQIAESEAVLVRSASMTA